MRALLATVVLVLVLCTGTASADTFALVPESPVGVPAGPLVLPSAEVPNQPGSILLPPGVWEAPFLPVQARSYDELQALWVRAGAAYGIPWQVLAAINQIESNFGRNMGPSSAGAVGWMQFIPDTWLRWGMDGNGDGIADPWNPDDGVHSAARYLAAANGRTDIERAIFAYNHAQWYVDDVLELAAVFGGGGGVADLVGTGATNFAGSDVVFTLDRMAIALEEAQEQVASLSELLIAAEEVDARLTAEAVELAQAADDLELLISDNVLAERDAFQAEQVRVAATAEVERLRAELTEAEAVLEAAESGALAASFSPAAASMLRMPTRADGYVFPVGGGPGVVSVGHDHHDYPAADIAAPLGTPLYALAAGAVISLSDSGNCGVGIVLQTVDGLEWVYCHLSYRDPGLASGSPLLAGQWVGLVGSTGNSTGPHLHLGLRPTRYPQEMPWFQEFAGIAFTWQDAVTEPPSQAARVFEIVPSEQPGDDVVEFTLVGA
ncbi:MAG: lytic murein transglycosylase [Gaiellaceae bacterium]